MNPSIISSEGTPQDESFSSPQLPEETCEIHGVEKLRFLAIFRSGKSQWRRHCFVCHKLEELGLPLSTKIPQDAPLLRGYHSKDSGRSSV